MTTEQIFEHICHKAGWGMDESLHVLYDTIESLQGGPERLLYRALEHMEADIIQRSDPHGMTQKEAS